MPSQRLLRLEELADRQTRARLNGFTSLVDANKTRKRGVAKHSLVLRKKMLRIVSRSKWDSDLPKSGDRSGGTVEENFEVSTLSRHITETDYYILNVCFSCLRLFW